MSAHKFTVALVIFFHTVFCNGNDDAVFEAITNLVLEKNQEQYSEEEYN